MIYLGHKEKEGYLIGNNEQYLTKYLDLSVLVTQNFKLDYLLELQNLHLLKMSHPLILSKYLVVNFKLLKILPLF